MMLFNTNMSIGIGMVVVVKCSVSLPSILMMRVRIPLKYPYRASIINFFFGGGEVRKELLVLSDGDHYLSSIYHIVVQSSNPAHLLNLLKDIASL